MFRGHGDCPSTDNPGMKDESGGKQTYTYDKQSVVLAFNKQPFTLPLDTFKLDYSRPCNEDYLFTRP